MRPSIDEHDGEVKMAALLPVILAGGAGTRLWPVSREAMPKHLADIIGEESLLQLTAKRVTAETAPDGLITVAARHQDLLIRRQLEAIDPALARHRLLEPVGRNTAAAIALAALHARKNRGRGRGPLGLPVRPPDPRRGRPSRCRASRSARGRIRRSP